MDCCRFLLIALSNLIWSVKTLPWYIQPVPPVLWLTRLDCPKCRSFCTVTTQSVDQTWQIKSDTEAGGFLALACHGGEFTKPRKIRHRQNIIPKSTKCINYVPCMSHIGPYETCKLCTQIYRVIHTPWKLKRTYSGCHSTHSIQHITLCFQGQWPN